MIKPSNGFLIVLAFSPAAFSVWLLPSHPFPLVEDTTGWLLYIDPLFIFPGEPQIHSFTSTFSSRPHTSKETGCVLRLSR
jgi:hypothetical protein